MLDHFLKYFYNFFGVEISGNEWADKLRLYLIEEPGLNAVVFDWPGGISRFFSIKPAAKKLKEFIEQQQNAYDSIVLFGKSLGGAVGEEATRLYPINKITKLIFIATPHRHKKINPSRRIKIINIFSGADRYQALANIFLNFGLGTKKIENGLNIEIPKLTHSQLNHNLTFEDNGQKINLYEFYRKIILS